MGLETSSLKLAIAMTGAADASLSKDVSNIVKNRSIIGAICMAIPLWGLEGIIYAITLWGMYIKLSEKANVPFWKNFLTNVLGGFIVNIVIVMILNFILDFIPIGGWIGAAIIGYCATLISGCAYLETLAALHGKHKVKERFNTDSAINYFNSNKNNESFKSHNTEIEK